MTNKAQHVTIHWREGMEVHKYGCSAIPKGASVTHDYYGSKAAVILDWLDPEDLDAEIDATKWHSCVSLPRRKQA